MEFSEQSLRKQLEAKNGDSRGGQALLNRLEGGDVLIVHMEDGRTLTLTEPYMARRLLRDVFGWAPSLGGAPSPLQSQRL